MVQSPQEFGVLNTNCWHSYWKLTEFISTVAILLLIRIELLHLVNLKFHDHKLHVISIRQIRIIWAQNDLIFHKKMKTVHIPGHTRCQLICWSCRVTYISHLVPESANIRGVQTKYNGIHLIEYHSYLYFILAANLLLYDAGLNQGLQLWVLIHQHIELWLKVLKNGAHFFYAVH